MSDELGETLDIGPAIRQMAKEELAKLDTPERTPLSERTRAMPGELDQLVARLTEIHDYQSHGVHVSNDPGGMGTIICFGQDMELRSWYVKANGQLSDGAEVDARAIADLWNALPTIIDGLSRVVALEQERRVIRNIGLKGLSDVDEILNIIEGALEHVLSRRSWIKEQLAVARQACDRFTEKLIATEAVTKPEGER